MFDYVNKKKLLAKLQDEIDYNWRLQETFGALAATLDDPISRGRHLEWQLQYMHRYEESVRIYNMLKDAT